MSNKKQTKVRDTVRETDNYNKLLMSTITDLRRVVDALSRKVHRLEQQNRRITAEFDRITGVCEYLNSRIGTRR